MRETHTPHFTTTTVDQASTRNHSMSDSVPDDHQPGSVSQDARNVHRSTPDPKTVEMIAYYQQAHKDHGFRLIESIRQNKDFGNPYILTKVVEHFKIDQIGSNYPKDIFDPLELTPEDFEASFKRRRTSAPPSTTGDSHQQYVNAAEQATQQAQLVQGAGPMAAVAPAQAAALAAALAAINARVSDASAARRDAAPSDGDSKRKSKWG